MRRDSSGCVSLESRLLKQLDAPSRACVESRRCSSVTQQSLTTFNSARAYDDAKQIHSAEFRARVCKPGAFVGRLDHVWGFQNRTAGAAGWRGGGPPSEGGGPPPLP